MGRVRYGSPSAVTLITSGPSNVFVSPPAIATSNSLGQRQKTLVKCDRQSAASRAIARPTPRQGQRNDGGQWPGGHRRQIAEIAANACRPIRRGSSVANAKSTPSVSMSVVTMTFD